MADRKIDAKLFRFDPSSDKEPRYQTYKVQLEAGMSAMDVLDYIYQNLDSTLAYYDHAGCSLGICARCQGKINGKTGLFCQTLVDGDITLEPASTSRVIKDLVIERGGKSNERAADNSRG